MDIDQEARVDILQDQRPHQIPDARMAYIIEHGITGADLLWEANPGIEDAVKLYVAQTAYFISVYGYAPQANVDISEGVVVKSGHQLQKYMALRESDDVRHALRERHADMRYHVLTPGGSLDAALSVPGLIETTNRIPTKTDTDTIYSLIAYALPTYLNWEKMRAVKTVNQSSHSEKKKIINIYGAEGIFSPAFLRLLSAIPPVQNDESDNPIPPLFVTGIVPRHKAQLRIAKVRDAFFDAQQAISRGEMKREILENLIGVITKNRVNLGLEEPLTPELMLEVLKDFPTQARGVNVRIRRKENNKLIGRRQDQLERDPQRMNWRRRDSERQLLLEELMNDAFDGRAPDFAGVEFPFSVVGKVKYSEKEQYSYPADFRNLEEDLRPVARLFASLLKAA